jgi:pimeloyl-ACP methyl ester carboxylesterase
MNYQIQGLSIHAEVLGTAEPPLVFLHYWGGTSRTWRKVTAELEGQWLAWLKRRARTLTLSRRASGKSNIRGTESGNIVPGVFTPVLAKCSKSFPLVVYALRNSCVHEGASPNFTIWGRTRENFQLLRRSDFRFFGPLRPNSLNRHTREFHLSGTPTIVWAGFLTRPAASDLADVCFGPELGARPRGGPTLSGSANLRSTK